jgi:hypothetical protein
MRVLRKKLGQKKIYGVFLVLVYVFLPSVLLGQIRESANYQIERDSLNVGGGLSESSNYATTDSVGQSVSGRSESSNFELGVAGFQQEAQVADVYISITSPVDVSMPSLSGFTGGVSTSSVGWNIETNNATGYELSVSSDTNPAMQSVSTAVIPNYVPTTANPDYTWSVSATEAAFGYSVSGANISDYFKDNGTSCNTGSGTGTDSCWTGFSTTNQIIATTNAQNAPTGATTTLDLQTEIGNDIFIDAGNYSATLTVTAVSL